LEKFIVSSDWRGRRSFATSWVCLPYHDVINSLANNYSQSTGYGNSKRKKFESDHTVVLKGSCCGHLDFVTKTKRTTTMCNVRAGRKFCGFSCSNGINCNEIIYKENCLICVQKGKREIKTIREFYDNKMVLTITCGDVEAKKYYKAAGTNKSLLEINFRCVRENNLI
jgi:hypothetical protein